MANKSVTDQYKSLVSSLNKTVAQNQYKSRAASLNKAVAKNASKTFSPTTEKRETYPKPGVTARTAAKNASRGVASRSAMDQHKSLVSSLNKTVATRGTARKAGTITNNAPKTGFSMGETTEARTSYGSTRPKSSATRAKKFY